MSTPEHPKDAPYEAAPLPLPPRDKRIVRHIKAIAESGGDIDKFVKALQAFRDDASLTTAQREAVFKTLAQDAAHAYFVMVTGKPVDWDKIIPRDQT
jgi:hypothetical protein